MNENHIDQWLNKEVSDQALIEQWPLAGLNSVLHRDNAPAVSSDGAIHPCGHWLYFVPAVHQEQIDVDGHPKRGQFIPPFNQARRMWAKSVITYNKDMNVDDRVEKKSIISRIDKKTGKSGDLIFLEIKNIYSVQNQVAREELQTIVYRDHQEYDDGIFKSTVEETPQWSQMHQLGQVELFRYSAITFNGHRIHYDSEYTRNVEGYPDIIVQGQFIATLIMSKALAAESIAACKKFTFKAVKPIFVNRKFFIEGYRAGPNKIVAWAREESGLVNMTAEIEI